MVNGRWNKGLVELCAIRHRPSAEAVYFFPKFDTTMSTLCAARMP